MYTVWLLSASSCSLVSPFRGRLFSTKPETNERRRKKKKRELAQKMLLTVCRGLCVWTTPGQREDGLKSLPTFIRLMWNREWSSGRLGEKRPDRSISIDTARRLWKGSSSRWVSHTPGSSLSPRDGPGWCGPSVVLILDWVFPWASCGPAPPHPPCPLDLRAPVWCSSCPSRCSLGLRCPVRRWTRPPPPSPPSSAGATLQGDNSSTREPFATQAHSKKRAAGLAGPSSDGCRGNKWMRAGWERHTWKNGNTFFVTATDFPVPI